MKRDIIIIEDKSVSVTGNDVWMTAGEIAGLFHTGVPAVNAAIKAILKTDVLSDYETGKPGIAEHTYRRNKRKRTAQFELSVSFCFVFMPSLFHRLSVIRLQQVTQSRFGVKHLPA